jgi:hypothetical protein
MRVHNLVNDLDGLLHALEDACNTARYIRNRVRDAEQEEDELTYKEVARAVEKFTKLKEQGLL